MRYITLDVITTDPELTIKKKFNIDLIAVWGETADGVTEVLLSNGILYVVKNDERLVTGLIRSAGSSLMAFTNKKPLKKGAKDASRDLPNLQ